MAKRDKHPFLDVDTTDEFLDLPELRYHPDGRPGRTGAELDKLRDPEYRRAHGIPDGPKLPPLTDH